MNRSKKLFVVVAALVTIPGLLICTGKSEVNVSASIQIGAPADFYQPLGACGTWVDVGSYGHCFRPIGVDADWQPYCNGSWVWTDCGWYWQSDEPWAWACYHYGNWVDDPTDGWIWVPGIEWAPAWVTWRAGGSFVGWAPAPPREAPPALFVFVDAGHFQDPIRRASVTLNNATAMSQTRVLAAPGREERTINGKSQEVVVNRGPDVGTIQKAAGKKISAVPIGEAMQKTTMPRNFAPASRGVEPNSMKQPEPDRNKPPTPDRPDNNMPAPAPKSPEDTRQPSIDLAPRAPTREAPEPAPRNDQQAPREPQRPSNEQTPEKPAQKPVNPPREEKPQQEEKPANPQPEQEKKDGQKDGLGRSQTMLAIVSTIAP